ncbi:MAG: leucine-rich repeat domain-containing protein [Christensenellaceae bacterium]|jgi:hypothetical protein|nr:leucine-rich repeat domain-containing protein [Christensenellaceae bacterium]
MIKVRGSKLLLLYITSILFFLLAFTFTACENDNNQNTGGIPTLIGVVGFRTGSLPSEDGIIYLTATDGVCEVINLEIKLLNSQKLPITSFKINNVTYSTRINPDLYVEFSTSDDFTKLSLIYQTETSEGEFDLKISDMYYEKDGKSYRLNITSNNTIHAKINPIFRVTTHVEIDDSYILDDTKLAIGSVVETRDNLLWVVASHEIVLDEDFATCLNIYSNAKMGYNALYPDSLDFCAPAYGFVGWFTLPNGQGSKVQPTGKYTFQSNLDLWAYYEPLFIYEIAQDENENEYAIIKGVTETGRDMTQLTIFYSIDGYFIKSIGANAFKNLSFNTLSLNFSIFEIGESAFEGFSGQINFNLYDDTVTEDNPAPTKSQLKTIANRAFANWTALYSGSLYFFIPDTVETIGNDAFLGTGWHTRVSFAGDVPDHSGGVTRELTLFIPDSVKSIGDRAFMNSKFERIYFERDPSLEFMGVSAFANSVSLLNVYTCAYMNLSQFKKGEASDIGIPYISNSAFEDSFVGLNPTNKNYDIYMHEGLITIGDRAFFSNSNSKFESLTFPDSVEKIGDSAFANFITLKSITFGQNSQLRTLGSYAFQSSAMSTVRLTSQALSTYGASPFYGNTALSTIYLNAIIAPTFSSAGQQGLAPNYVKYLVPDVLAYRTNGWNATACPRMYAVQNLTLRDSYSGAQFGYEEIDGGVRLTYTLYQADSRPATAYFPGSVYIPTSENGEIRIVLAIGSYVSHQDVESIILPSSLTSIDSYAFAGCNKLTAVYTNSTSNAGFSKLTSLQNIGSYAFMGTRISQFVAPGSIRTINASAFSQNSALNLVYINPDDTGMVISAEAFTRTSVETVYIGTRVDYICDGAFAYCQNLKDVYIYRAYPPNSIGSFLISPFAGSVNNDLTVHVRPNSIDAFMQVAAYSILDGKYLGDAVAIPEIS